MTGANILVVDDDASIRAVLVGLLTQGGYAARGVESGELALEAIGRDPIDVVITDVRMPGMGGMALLAALGTSFPELPVIMISAHATVPMAVEAMKLGAKELMTKPFDRQEVLALVARTLEASASRAAAPPSLPIATRLAGASRAMVELGTMVERASQSEATVLLRGESGTGKEVAAREIHARSARRDGPFVAVHCAALPETLLESELFGYEAGAFTGATRRKPGRVELAAGGVLFLDEIGDVSPAIQVKLLRLLQERVYTPVGGTHELRANTRFIAATHRDLESMASRNEFRADLFYRLNVLPIWLPPLRDRLEDLPMLAERFCREAALRNGLRMPRLADDAIAALAAHAWPGNVRELQACVERLVVFADGESISAVDVERDAQRAMPVPTVAPIEDGTLDEHVEDAERRAVKDALARARGSRTLAARLLGVSRRTLYNKMTRLGVA